MDKELTYTSIMRVDMVDKFGDDALICKAARVSTLGAESIKKDEYLGLINFLMKNRHGSPFEHGYFCFRIHAPIFVWHEFMRHRIGFSYNEQSGRYMELEPTFYIPSYERPIVQVGKPGAYEFVPGKDSQIIKSTIECLQDSYEVAWDSYQEMLSEGVAKEVARMCLPVGIFSTAYVSCNPRSLMRFLSLRTKDETSHFPSYPQHEIELVASKMERLFEHYYPLTHKAFCANGRVSP